MTGRLGAILSHVSGKTLADIGCDHGKVAVYALKGALVSNAIATDISAKSLEKAKVLAEQEDVGNIIFKVGDGMSVLEDNEADVVVIAGMGGREIMSIMEGRRKGIDKYILSPNRNAEQLREYLVGSGLRIVSDKIVRDGKHYYSVIVCVSGFQSLSQRQRYLGDNDIADSDYISFVKLERDKCISALDKAGERANAQTLQKLQVILKELSRLC